MKIYLASSWRNPDQPVAIQALRAAGHEVYDFRNPGPGEHGFSWSEIDPDWRDWTPEQFREALGHPIAEHGFGLDHAGMEWADICVLLLPCGRSAHIESGEFIGKPGKGLVILLSPRDFEPELMYLGADAICVSMWEVTDFLGKHPIPEPPPELDAGRGHDR